jgi:amino acid adenylation domain-containing protein
MNLTVPLHRAFEDCAATYPDRTAVEEASGESITYGDLAALSSRLRDRLISRGVRPDDRVGIWMPKSIDAVVSILAILKTGAAYVPVDPTAPAARNSYILNDCTVSAVIAERRLGESAVWDRAKPELLFIDQAGGGLGLRRMLQSLDTGAAFDRAENHQSRPEDLAYILYTSGSTGKPKGVMLSHQNAVSFVNWCAEVFNPRPEDRFSSHAPLHFDLSVLDLFLSLSSGATVILIPEDLGKEPAKLAPFIAEKKITVWYSAPSILGLLVQYGALEKYDYSPLRIILFAGEVFPLKHLRALKATLPKPRYFNLYGPTETNVCTYYEVPEMIPAERNEPFPIGRACSHLAIRLVDEEGKDVPYGERGELCVTGAGVMQGYWNLSEQTAKAFLRDSSGCWYKTGDIAIADDNGDYVFIGRKDRMVKRRGYRVELGEVESALYRHPAVREAAAIALEDAEAGVKIKVFLGCREGKRPSIIELKRFCMQHLPTYMIPDIFALHESLPKTSTAKIDYQRLKEMN